MKLPEMIKAARLSLILLPSAQRAMAELMLNEAERMNAEYDSLKGHVEKLTARVNELTQCINGIAPEVASHRVALAALAN